MTVWLPLRCRVLVPVAVSGTPDVGGGCDSGTEAEAEAVEDEASDVIDAISTDQPTIK